jgi:type II secretory pathway component GspD/PulD (secretin)
MSVFRIPALLAVSILAVSCSHLGSRAPNELGAETTPETNPRLLEDLRRREHDELLQAAQQRLREARRLLKANDLPAAEAALQPLVGQPLFRTQVAELQTEIQAARNNALIGAGKLATEKRALTEVRERLVLPSKYGSTVVISKHETPIEVPPGPMEELVNKKVTMTLQNAGVGELVQVLSDVEGLNVVADDALEAEKTLTISVREVPLKEVLSYIARNMGVAFHLGENIIWVTESTEPPGAGPKLETQVYRLRQGFIPSMGGGGGGGGGGGVMGGGGAGGGASEDDNDLEDALAAVLADSPDGATYRIFKNRNLLLVRDSRENLRIVEELIKEFDKPPYQVLIEARFLTISQDDLLDVGTELNQLAEEHSPPEYLFNPITQQFEKITSDQARSYYTNLLKQSNNPDAEVTDFLTELGALVPGAESGLGYLSLSGIVGNRTYQLVLSAVSSKQSTKTLSAPRVTVLNNQMARLRKGDTLLYYSDLETVAASGGGDGGSAAARTALTGEPQELELGVTFDVKVNVGNDGETVLLSLKPEIIDLLRWREFNVVAGEGDGTNNDDSGNNTQTGDAVGKIELPETTESTIETKVAVKSGETVILGGMAGTKEQNLVKKVPILGDIPWLGFFFRRTKTTEIPQHLLIFVTARVVNDTGQFVTHQAE